MNLKAIRLVLGERSIIMFDKLTFTHYQFGDFDNLKSATDFAQKSNLYLHQVPPRHLQRH